MKATDKKNARHTAVVDEVVVVVVVVFEPSAQANFLLFVPDKEVTHHVNVTVTVPLEFARHYDNHLFALLQATRIGTAFLILPCSCARNIGNSCCSCFMLRVIKRDFT